MSRQRIQIDLNRVEELAAQGLSQAEICATLGISEDTLTRRKRDSAGFAEVLKKGKAKAAATISNKLFELAKGGNLSAIIWWEKTRMEYTDRVRSELGNADRTPISPAQARLALLVQQMTPEQRQRIRDRIAKRQAGTLIPAPALSVNGTGDKGGKESARLTD